MRLIINYRAWSEPAKDGVEFWFQQGFLWCSKDLRKRARVSSGGMVTRATYKEEWRLFRENSIRSSEKPDKHGSYSSLVKQKPKTSYATLFLIRATDNGLALAFIG